MANRKRLRIWGGRCCAIPRIFIGDYTPFLLRL
jgi:hypothetical protein